MTREPVPVMADNRAISAATIGRVRQQLVARVPSEILNPFGRTAQDEQALRDAIKAILDDPELELTSEQIDGKLLRKGRKSFVRVELKRV